MQNDDLTTANSEIRIGHSCSQKLVNIMSEGLTKKNMGMGIAMVYIYIYTKIDK